MNFLKAALTFILALAPAHAALVTPEFQFDTPVDSPSARFESSPSVAFNGRIYVVAWMTALPPELPLIRWKKFDASGKPLAPAQSLMLTNAMYPTLASNGDGFVMIFHQSGAFGALQNAGVRLDANGDLAPNSYFGPVNVGEFPSIASNGADYIVFAGWPAVAFSRITASGFGPVTRPAGAAGGNTHIAFEGDSYLAVWTAGPGALRQAFAHRISAQGALLTENPITLSTGPANAYNISVAGVQNTFMVTWLEQTPLGAVIKARRLDSSGALLEGTPFTLQGDDKAGSAMIAPHGNAFLLASYYLDPAMENFELRTALVSLNGVVGRTQTISTRISPSNMQLAMNARGTNTMLAWVTKLPETEDDVYANFIPSEGSALQPPEVLEKSANVQTAPAAAFGANGYLVVWQDNRSSLTNSDDIYGIFVDENGCRMSSSFPIASGMPDQTSPAVAAAGDRYLVVWREDATARIDDDDIKGTLIENQRVVRQLTISAGNRSQRGPAVASNGKDFLVVWRDDRQDALDEEVFGAHVSGEGVVSGPEDGFLIGTGNFDQAAPAVASNGTNYLVVWRDSRFLFDGPGEEIYGAIVQPGEATMPVNFPVASWMAHQRGPDVASNGTNYFVVWRDTRDDGNNTVSIYGGPVSAAGAVQNPYGYPLAPAASNQREPSIVRSGENYMIAWLSRDGSNGADTYNVFTRQISKIGQAISPAAKVSQTAYDRDTLALASGGGSTALMLSQTLVAGLSRVQGAVICATNCPTVIDVAFDSTKRTLSWNGEANQTYRIEYKDSLHDATWRLLVEQPATSDGFVQATDVAAATTRFYRVVKAP